MGLSAGAPLPGLAAFALGPRLAAAGASAERGAAGVLDDADGLQACAGDAPRRRVIAARRALVLDQALGLEAAEDLGEGATGQPEGLGQRQDRTVVALRGGAEDHGLRVG
jgi:hypothetical protein